MRTSISLGFVVLVSLIVLTSRAGAQPIVNLDENGHGNIVGGGPVPATVAADPTNGKATLVYQLPFVPSVPGDVQVFENAAGGTFSDVLRFIPGSPQLFVYSDLAESGELPDLADVGLPPNVVTPLAQRNETGGEGNNNGLFPYTPTPNEPGFLVGANAQYNFTSDLVPEPDTLAVLVSLASLKLRRRRSA